MLLPRQQQQQQQRRKAWRHHHNDAALLPLSPCRMQMSVCLFLAALSAAVLVSCSVHAVSHWVISDGVIVPQTGFSKAPCTGLNDFIDYNNHWEFFRREAKSLHDVFEMSWTDTRPLPDVLSNNRDYTGRRALSSLEDLPTTYVPLSSKNIFPLELASSRAVSGNRREPHCNATLIYSLGDFQHLPSVALRANLSIPPEPHLETTVWPYNERGVRYSTVEMGTALAAKLQKNSTSFIYLNLAALYWRIRGNATESVECLRRALAFGPVRHRDVAMLSLANILLRSKHASDAAVVIQNAVHINNESPYIHFTHGQILAALEQYSEAITAHQQALAIRPGFTVSQQAIEAILTHQKIAAAKERRAFEIAVRKLSMVLPPKFRWDDFDYEPHDDACVDVECPKMSHVHCSPMDGKCYCDEGFKRQDGKCVVDAKCQQVACKLNGLCREGKCFCKPGFIVKGGACEPDPCAKVVCIEGAVCNVTDGRCTCGPHLVQQGATCVTPSCLTANCSRDAVCKDGICFCKPGFKGNGEICSAVGVCEDSRCPPLSQCDPSTGHCRCIKGYQANFRQNECLPSNDASDTQTLGLAYQEEELSSEPTVKEMELFSSNTGSEDKFASLEEDCPASTRRTPAFHEYTSTCLPSWHNVQEILALVGPVRPAPEHFLQPFCARSDFPFSVRMLDHLPGMASRHDRDAMLRYSSEATLRDFASTLFGQPIEIIDMGHMVALALNSHPTESVLYNLATLFWRVNGNARQALECVRYALHYAKADSYDVPLTNAANIFQKAGFVADAGVTSRLALLFTKKQHTIAHFTYANALAARGVLDQAAAHYVHALRLQPSLDLARQWLRTVQCLQRHKQRKEEEMASLKVRLNQIQDMLSKQEKHESSHLWDQLKQAEQRLDELVRQQAVPEQGNIVKPAASSTAASTASSTTTSSASSSSSSSSSSSTSSSSSASPSSAPSSSSTARSINGDGTDRSLEINSIPSDQEPRIIAVEYPKEPSIRSLIVAIEGMFRSFNEPLVKIESGHHDNISSFTFSEPLSRPNDCVNNPVIHAAIMSYSNTWMSPLGLAKFPMDWKPIVPGSEPVCRAARLPSQHDNDYLEHLFGVRSRATLTLAPETSLQDTLYDSMGWNGISPVDVGPTLAAALKAEPSSWTALNFAALYWRIKGKAERAIECLQQAFVYGPPENKDVALVGLANVLHLSNHSIDALTVIQMAVQLSPQAMINHLTLANILMTMGRDTYPEAMFFYEVVLRLRPDVTRAVNILREIRCVLTEKH